jgi:RNA polymerase sigma-70 factor (ECF subfamily)
MGQDQALVTLDDATFGPMTEPLRHDLLLHCYRFTGSLHDAEDLVQETLVKAWRGRADYRGEAGLRTWLRRIATRACLDALRDRPERTLPSAVGQGAGHKTLWLEALPDEFLADVASDPAATYELRESVSLAFLVALQRLPPRQRAVLILRDVLALRASETAASLDISVSAVNSLLHRARRTMSARYTPASAPSQQNVQTARLLRRYIAAWEANDIDALMATLKSDAKLEMPPIPVASFGHAAIRSFLADGIIDGPADKWRGVTTEANGGPAVAIYQRDGDHYWFTGLHLLTVDGEQIATVTAFMDKSLATRFRLPDKLDPRLADSVPDR